MRIDKPDITNEDPRYWESVLESHRLGERQLGLHEPTENDVVDEELETIPLDANE